MRRLALGILTPLLILALAFGTQACGDDDITGLGPEDVANLVLAVIADTIPAVIGDTLPDAVGTLPLAVGEELVLVIGATSEDDVLIRGQTLTFTNSNPNLVVLTARPDFQGRTVFRLRRVASGNATVRLFHDPSDTEYLLTITTAAAPRPDVIARGALDRARLWVAQARTHPGKRG